MSETKAPEAAKTADPPKTQSAWKSKAGAKGLSIMQRIGDLGSGLSSPDLPTRRMSLFFFLSLVGVFLVVGVTARRMTDQNRGHTQEATAASIELFLQKREEEARRRFTMMELGTFTVELKVRPGQKPIVGIANMGELTLVVQCDDPKTQVFLERNLAKVRSQITSVFLALDRDDLLTRDGKKKLKKQLMDRLNSWLPSGKIVDVFFSNLVVA